MIDMARKCVVVAVASGLTTLGFALAGCTGDDTPAGVLPDASRSDTASPTGDAAQPPSDAGAPAKVLVVHASPDLPAVRVCFAIGTKSDGSDGVIAPLPPLPDRVRGSEPFPGISPGAAAVVDDFGVDLSAKVVVPYVILASAVASDARSDAGPAPTGCDALLSGGAGALASTAYLKLAPIAASTFNRGESVLLAATGCLPQALDPAASSSLCGSSYSAITGNVSLKVFKLDTKVTATGAQLGAQFAQLSSPVQGSLAPMGVTAALSSASAPDGGPPVALAIGAKFGDLAPKTAAVASVGNVDDATLSLTTVNADGGASLPLATLPLPLIYTLSTGQLGSAASYFRFGANYTFVLVGDPAEPAVADGGLVNGRALHVVAMPSDPVVAKYAP